MFIIIAFVAVLLGQMSSGGPLDVAHSESEWAQYFGPRIVGGQEAVERVPHMAALVVGTVFKSLVCGASIVSDRHLLTAAHCVAPYITWDGTLFPTFHATVGHNQWRFAAEVYIKDHRNHPDYNSWTMKNDIGVLITREKIPLGRNVAVIGLHPGFVGGGQPVNVAGWGTQQLGGTAPSQLQTLSMLTVPGAECQAIMLLDPFSPPVDPAQEICTYHSPGHGMCHGDSGSALTLSTTGAQVGIVSWGSPCARGAPDIFVRVSAFLEFLDAALAVH